MAKLLAFLLISIVSLAASQMYTRFKTHFEADQTKMYDRLKWFNSTTKTMIKFLASDKSIDYSSLNWMDDCYIEYDRVPTNQLVVFWMVEGNVHCEAVAPVRKRATPSYSVENLMRVELDGDRCEIIE